MNCEDVRLLLPNLLDSELSEEMEDRLRKHLLGCPDCDRERSTLAEALRLLKASAPSAEPRDLWKSALLERLEKTGLEEGWLAPAPEPVSPRQLVLASLIVEMKEQPLKERNP
ncbi:MAG: zf-HC2 domain-containing protein [Armatimonadetes bacterium]|nr:zf-HC2 domain-containing protein [Armatimonadota bacterium]